jgi:hypothetical protein
MSMSDWPDQISEFQRNWAEQQRKLMSDWLDSMKSAGGGSASASWRQAADVMEQQVDSALDAQKQSLLAVAGNMQNVEGAPDALNQAVQQLEEGIEQWVEVQHKMWNVWFDMLRAASAEPRSPAESIIENWEDMVKRTMAIQEEWLSSLAGPQLPSGGKSAKPAGKSATPAGKSAKPAGKSAKPAGKSAKPAGKSAKPAGKSATPARKTKHSS